MHEDRVPISIHPHHENPGCAQEIIDLFEFCWGPLESSIGLHVERTSVIFMHFHDQSVDDNSGGQEKLCSKAQSTRRTQRVHSRMCLTSLACDTIYFYPPSLTQNSASSTSRVRSPRGNSAGRTPPLRLPPDWLTPNKVSKGSDRDQRFSVSLDCSGGSVSKFETYFFFNSFTQRCWKAPPKRNPKADCSQARRLSFHADSLVLHKTAACVFRRFPSRTQGYIGTLLWSY